MSRIKPLPGCAQRPGSRKTIVIGKRRRRARDWVARDLVRLAKLAGLAAVLYVLVYVFLAAGTAVSR